MYHAPAIMDAPQKESRKISIGLNEIHLTDRLYEEIQFTII